jgi:hypothetical protein
MVSPAEWKLCQKWAREHSNFGEGRCTICGGRGRRWPVECHEVWSYEWDEENQRHVQRLVSLVSLCPLCHEVKHFGLAELKGRGTVALAHLRAVNAWIDDQVQIHLLRVRVQFQTRSEVEWWLDTTWLDANVGVKGLLLSPAERQQRR